MQLISKLITRVQNLEGKSYGAYKSLVGAYDGGKYIFHIDRVQSDPYAPPSNCRISCQLKNIGLELSLVEGEMRKLATADYLARQAAAVFSNSHYPNSCRMRIDKPGQEILARSYARIQNEQIELNVQIEFPAYGRRIKGKEFAYFLEKQLPILVRDSLNFTVTTGPEILSLQRHIHTYEDYLALQEHLKKQNWVAFIAEGAILARASGISDKPMLKAVPFCLPKMMRSSDDRENMATFSQHCVQVELPHAGIVKGLAIKPGLTVIVGGGYHGKSTLLRALELAVYAHIPGDGRELVATLPQALKIQAEDGRAVRGVDISMFIRDLPGGVKTQKFFTENASGSTSQAAAICEAIEAKCPLLLIDEDTSATNLLIRDQKMRKLVPDEPIVPLEDQIKTIVRKRKTSVIMVMGGSCAYIPKADYVLRLDRYIPADITQYARQICGVEKPRQVRLNNDADMALQNRWQPRERYKRYISKSLPPMIGKREKTRTQGCCTIILNKTEIDISALSQITDFGQTQTLAYLIRKIISEPETGYTLIEQVQQVMGTVKGETGTWLWEKLGNGKNPAHLVEIREIDLIAALNRYRHLQIV